MKASTLKEMLATGALDKFAHLYSDTNAQAERFISAIDAFVEKHNLGAAVINTGNPGEYTIRQLAEETLRQIPESTSQIVYEPLPKDDPKRRKPDITLAKELLGWEPAVPLQEGLAKTIEYFRKTFK